MNLKHALQNYFARHAQVALDTLGRLYRMPLPSLMTAAVIGIALALPSGLYLLTGNLQRLSVRRVCGFQIDLLESKKQPCLRCTGRCGNLGTQPAKFFQGIGSKGGYHDLVCHLMITNQLAKRLDRT